MVNFICGHPKTPENSLHYNRLEIVRNIIRNISPGVCMEIYLIVADNGAYSNRTWEPVCAYASLAEAASAAAIMKEKHAIYKKAVRAHWDRKETLAKEMFPTILTKKYSQSWELPKEQLAQVDEELGPKPTWDHDFPPADEYVIETVTLHQASEG